MEKNQYNVGDIVYVNFPSRANNYGTNRKGTVVKVTPTGQMTVEIDSYIDRYRFNKHGHEIGASSIWYYARIISYETYQANLIEERKVLELRDLKAKINELSRDRLYPESKEALLVLIAEIKRGIENL